MKRAALSLALMWGLSSCIGPFAAGPSGGLMYQVPDPPTLTYLTGDTSTIQIDAGPMGSLRMRSTGTATLAMAFERAEGGMQVTATFQEMNARMTQPMGGAVTADQDDLEGPVVFTMDNRGHSTVVSIPEIRGQAAQMANPHAIAYEFFPRLPGGAAEPGESWTDTIYYEAETGEGETANTTVMTYTVQGDTVVDGATLVKINMSGTADVVATMVTEGMEVTQIFSGDATGYVLWDPARSVYVGGYSEIEGAGTVEVPAAGMPPMPLTVSGVGHAKLQGG